jgi:hypothetical protein
LRGARDCILVNPVERGEMGPDLLRAASSSIFHGEIKNPVSMEPRKWLRGYASDEDDGKGL